MFQRLAHESKASESGPITEEGLERVVERYSINYKNGKEEERFLSFYCHEPLLTYRSIYVIM